MTFPYSNYKGAGEKLAKGGGLQQAVVVNGIVHIAGQGARSLQSSLRHADTLVGGVNDNVELLSDGKAQIRQACLNAGKAVEAAGAMGGLKDIFKVRLHTRGGPVDAA